MALSKKTREGYEQEAGSEAASVAFLVDLAARGDREAFERLVARFWGDIFRLAYYRTSSRDDAEELAQDIFMKAFNNIGGLKEPEKFKSWLYSIGLNRIRDYYRRKKVRSIITLFSAAGDQDGILEISDQGPTAGEDLERREFWRRVGDFSDKLPRAEGEVFRLRFMDQLTLKETAQALGKSESTIKTHLYRALTKLRENRRLLEALR